MYDIVLYMVYKRLSGKGYILDKLYHYFVHKVSPSQLVEEGLGKMQLRRYITYTTMLCGSYAKAVAIFKNVYPVVVEKVEPIVKKVDGELKCIVCDLKLGADAELHVRTAHREYAEKLAWEIIEEVRKRLSIGKEIG